MEHNSKYAVITIYYQAKANNLTNNQGSAHFSMAIENAILVPR